MLTIEVGGSSTQAIQFERPEGGVIVSVDEHRSEPWLLAAPGLVEGNRIRGAHQLGWMDVQASDVLHMQSPPLLSMNDAEAAALGEWWLSGQHLVSCCTLDWELGLVLPPLPMVVSCPSSSATVRGSAPNAATAVVAWAV